MKKLKFTAAICVAAFILGSASAKADKKPLDHSVYDSWESVSSMTISDDGQFATYRIVPQQGDGQLVIRNLQTSKELVIERATDFQMTTDGKSAVCTIKPAYALTRQARIDKKKADEMPKDTLAYIDLGTMQIKSTIPNAGASKMGYEAAPYVFVAQNPHLLVLSTRTGVVDTIKNVSDFAVSKSGYQLGVITKKDEKDSLSRNSVMVYNYITGKDTLISADKKAYGAMRFDDGGNKFLFIATDQEEKTDGTPSYSIFLAERVVVKKATRRAAEVAEIRISELSYDNTSGLPEGWVLGKNSRPKFSNDGSRIVLNLERYFPAKDTTVVDFEAAQLDIWLWDAQVLPPMDKAQAARVRSNLTAIVNLDTPENIITLSTSVNDVISFVNGANEDFAFSIDVSPYVQESFFANHRKSDLYVINLNDGSRRSLVKGLIGNIMLSPKGNYILWFDSRDGHFRSINVADAKVNELTSKVDEIFYNEDSDTPSGYRPYSSPSWVGDDDYFLLTDRYDIWKFSPDGSQIENLSKSVGRKNNVQFRINNPESVQNPYLHTVIEEVSPKDPIYLSAYNEKTKMNGVGMMMSNKANEPQWFVKPYFYAEVMKAADAQTVLYLKGNFNNPMDLYVTTIGSSEETKLTSINQQQKDYNWGDVQLVHWDAYDGTALDGLLFTPENLDKSKKYPLLIYFYEKYSETLYNYRAPAPSRSTVNIPYFVSRGYVVFVPDIVYNDGHPGESAYNCVCSGAEAMCEQFSFINKDKMGIQGQSWGGYQTAYLVTRTDMFAAGGAGAPVANMTSAYGGIRWESGMSRITQYEYGQSRIGKSLWDEGGLDLYIENSPIFFAPKVNTPVLIMHNDADGAVPWYQGIEFFMSLRRLGKPAWLLQYNNEAHNLSERRNSKDLSIRLQQFFDHYLMDAPMPVWMESGIPYQRKGNYYGFEYAE